MPAAARLVIIRELRRDVQMRGNLASLTQAKYISSEVFFKGESTVDLDGLKLAALFIDRHGKDQSVLRVDDAFGVKGILPVGHFVTTTAISRQPKWSQILHCETTILILLHRRKAEENNAFFHRTIKKENKSGGKKRNLRGAMKETEQIRSSYQYRFARREDDVRLPPRLLILHRVRAKAIKSNTCAGKPPSDSAEDGHSDQDCE
ncbi:hypothetical protein PHSY_003534 [Pseudozyma hubeiensis SY62]|uniref:Uncharacterized protein n=1 Tax=Pseudozyma hubeiensis (strain SY62) TaxID=1305764 RepID=R9P3M1_PSEHS|nr:hypothetical protein PHSY_003534 [Pseudozyma hubeiensis SY62]GAC95956.1 hypothetical protein PHSY_003534 [Pseudozyma hubeiensis SY62]